MKPADDDQTGCQVARVLSAGLECIDTVVADRLHDARRAALMAPSAAGNRRFPAESRALVSVFPWLRIALMLCFLSTGAVVAHVWGLHRDADELGEIDSALLADDLPPAAYFDQEFRQWLERSSSDSSSH